MSTSLYVKNNAMDIKYGVTNKNLYSLHFTIEKQRKIRRRSLIMIKQVNSQNYINFKFKIDVNLFTF